MSDSGFVARTDQALAGLADPEQREHDWLTGVAPLIDRLAENLGAEFEGHEVIAGRVLVAAGCELTNLMARRAQAGHPQCPAVNGLLSLMGFTGERLVHPRADA